MQDNKSENIAYGEEEVCSDRLDNDFPDIDLSQLDTSDFDSVNCLSELQWCNDQPSDRSPASINYSTTDELFEEENAALLAALTDSLDGMVDAEVGGLSVFPVLGEEPNQEEEDEDNLSLSAEDFSQSLGSETEDPSLPESSAAPLKQEECLCSETSSARLSSRGIQSTSLI
ncbi:hypothetical protein JOQ06_016556 [Pogonophryne albipinna]|uniref:Uncharacterized protein n=1 Tax=Pogonophryne albipinna TaxID=1090488 RepID=A0AAD6ABI2_9TELE|nr:hypothetical protein JOQ06_016556 [Pogonophryne albipinna]